MSHHHLSPEIAAIAFQNTRDGILITDSDNKIIFVNQAFTDVTGYSSEEALGKGPDLLKSGKHSEQFYNDMWSSISSDGYWEGEIWDKRKNGEIYLEYLSVNTFKNSQGEIVNYIGVFTDLQNLYSDQESFENRLRLDGLTDLPGRDKVIHFLKKHLFECRRNRKLLAVMSLDLDNFKSLNDQFGHSVGDRILVVIAMRLKKLIRSTDIVGRQGGDEFVLVLPDLNNVDEIEQMTNRILALVSTPVELDGNKHYLSTSIGLTLFPFDDSDADMLIRHADQAMYKAKEYGKNQSHIFDIEKDREAKTRREIIQRLQQALDNNELLLYYQPKVNMRKGIVIGAEALIRWNHPEEGLLNPGSFLPYIEDHELIVQIGDWVMREALSQITNWSQQGINLPVSVNVSARQILQRDFIDNFKSILRGHPPDITSMLELEILESSALENTQHVASVIEQCRDFGVKFALDDFGTGFASLSYLRDIPADVLKIDQSFVFNLLDNQKDLALIEGVVGLATVFQRMVIAEGVETTEHGVLLLRLGCDYGQGYGIARPMPAHDISKWVLSYEGNRDWAMWADTAWEIGDFPLLVAQYDHINWVKRVLTCLEGNPGKKIKQEKLLDHHECRFGNWYYNQGMEKYHNVNVFKEIEPIHVAVHQVGNEIAKLSSTGEMEAAKEQAKQLLILKDQILEKMAILQRHVANTASLSSR